jgi:hypothetical protein
MYFGKNRKYHNSRWFLQGKVGYGLLKGNTYLPGSVPIYDSNNNYQGSNSIEFVDKRRMSFNYGFALGYKAIVFNRLALDFYLGSSQFTTPNFEKDESLEKRQYDWTNGIGAPVELHWSLGFFID